MSSKLHAERISEESMRLHRAFYTEAVYNPKTRELVSKLEVLLQCYPKEVALVSVVNALLSMTNVGTRADRRRMTAHFAALMLELIDSDNKL